MGGTFGASTTIERPVAEVFAFLAAGTNDPQFSPRVKEIRQLTDGPVGVGTVFESRVNDAGMKTGRTNEITELVEPTRIRWRETSKNLVKGVEGGYDLEDLGGGRTKLTFHNTLEGFGVGKLFAGFALKAARKDQQGFVDRIKAAVERS